MSRYYECDNILNNCCDKYKKKCHKKRSKHKRYDDYYDYYNYNLGSYEYPSQPNYNPIYQNAFLPSYNSGSYDNILILLLIIVLLSNGSSTTCCEY